MVRYAIEHPGWTGVYVEFWTHASHRPELRRRVAEQHERLLDTVGALVEEWAGRWEVEFTLPPREVVRGTYALSRGMGLERLLADEPGTAALYEEMFLAYAMGLIGRAPPARQGREAPMTTTTSTSTPSAQADRLRALAVSSSPGTGGRATGCSPTRASGCGR